MVEVALPNSSTQAKLTSRSSLVDKMARLYFLKN
jgi:hypothetical protein